MEKQTRLKAIDILRNLIRHINRSFWHIFSSSSAPTFSGKPPLSLQKSTQKVSISVSKAGCARCLINNKFYDDLHEDWYTAQNHPVALLRAENAIRTPWVDREINERFSEKIKVLDIGCGAGFLTNALAKNGHKVFGIDLSEESLKMAQKKDETKTVHYEKANAYLLPFPNHSFDAVCAMDVLEHVEKPALLIDEASRVLKKDGLFFFHTFNRNFLSYLMIIKGVDWFVSNAPQNMHVYPLFIKPKELISYCEERDLFVEKMIGLRPSFSKAFFKMLFTRKVPADFSFCFSKSLSTGYCGIAKKRS